MPNPLTLSVLHAGAKSLIVMRSLLNLAGGDRQWQVIDQPGGDLTIIDVDQPQGALAWDGLDHAGRQHVALTSRSSFPAAVLLRKPLRSREFLDLLARFDGGGIDRPVHAVDEARTVRWESMEIPVDAGLLPLAEHLRRGSWKGPVLLVVDGWPELIIDPGSGSWFYDGAMSDMTPAMFASEVPASCGLPLDSEALVHRCAGMSQRSLSELKWFAGLAQSRGRLHPDLVGPQQFMLTQVPSYALDNARFQHLAQTLIRGPITLDQLQARTGESVETIAAFLNACHTSGRLLINQSARVAGF